MTSIEELKNALKETLEQKGVLKIKSNKSNDETIYF